MAYVTQVHPRTGEKPGPGIYTCMNCNWRVEIESRADPLPPCKNCDANSETRFRRIAG